MVCSWHVGFLDMALKRNKNDLDALVEARQNLEAIRRSLSSLIPIALTEGRGAPALCCVESLHLGVAELVRFVCIYRDMPDTKKRIMQWVSRRYCLMPLEQCSCGTHTASCYVHYSVPSHEAFWLTNFPDLEMLTQELDAKDFDGLAREMYIDADDLPYQEVLADYISSRADIETTRSRLVDLGHLVREAIDVFRIVPLAHVARVSR